MTDETEANRTDWARVDPAEHVRRSAATFRVVKDMEDALGRAANNMEDYFTAGFQWRGNVGCGTKDGLAAFRRNWQGPLRAAFAERTYTTERFLADGDWAACVGVLEGTHVGPFMGIAPTGLRVRIPYMDIWRVEGGRIADNPVFVDFAAVCLQLGRDVFAGEGWEAFDRGERAAPQPGEAAPAVGRAGGSMQGFDLRYVDPPDYILQVTKEIWEDRGIDTLHRSYAPGIVVRSPSGVMVGNQGVIGATMATLAEFPDRTLLGEDVIWCDDGAGGFLSSHRILSTATHLGHGAYGPASGRSLRYRIIADCHAASGVIDDEWLIRDQGAIVRQMGSTPEDWARARVAEAAEGSLRPFTPALDQPGPYLGRGNEDEWGARHEDLVRRIMRGDLAAIPTVCDRALQAEMPGGVTGHGWEAWDRFWLGLRAAFPDAAFHVEHRIGRTDPDQPHRSALRWSLTGRHAGWGAFGAPSGAQVHVMGLSHAEWGPRGLRRDWTIYDETAVWTQIVLHRGG